MMVFNNIKISDYNIVFDEIFNKNNLPKLFLLSGEIGSGKTTLIKSFLKRLMVNGGVSSPTFNIINEYINSGNYCFIEWPEISKTFLDRNFVNITLSFRDHSSRDIKITFH